MLAWQNSLLRAIVCFAASILVGGVAGKSNRTLGGVVLELPSKTSLRFDHLFEVYRLNVLVMSCSPNSMT